MEYNCWACKDELEDISFSHTINGGIVVWLSHKEKATLYVCTSQDCKNRGIVIAIGHEIKEED